MSADKPLVLVVEDEDELAELYTDWLTGTYRVRTVRSGTEALDELDERVDVILLDRQLPDISGDDVLERIRERDVHPRIAMVTASEPDTDIVELDFDEYLVKPVTKERMRMTVSNLLLRNEYGEGIQELFALASKKALLESDTGEGLDDESEEYQRLVEELEKRRAALDETLDRFSESADPSTLYRDISDDENGR